MRRRADPCDHCGCTGAMHKIRRVRVPRRHPSAPDVHALALCHTCRTGGHRTWRLRWRPIEGADLAV